MPLRCLLPGAAALMLLACSPALNWREVRPEASGAVALFPCKPASHARNVVLAQAAVRLTLYACNAGGATWAIAYAETGSPARVGPALVELRKAAATNIGAVRELPLVLRVAGATPNAEAGRFALTGSLPDGKAVQEQVAVFARGTVVFQATALGERLDAEAAENFFSGLRVLP
jgi:hypothetical protein